MGSCRRCSGNGIASRCWNAEHGADYWRGASPQRSKWLLSLKCSSKQWRGWKSRKGNWGGLAIYWLNIQAILRSLPEQQSSPTSPPHSLALLRGEVEDVLPGTVNTVRGAVERVGQVPDLGNPPTLRGDMLEDISSWTLTGGSPSHSPKAGLIFNIGSHCKTYGVTQGDDSILQSVPGALCQTKPS